MTTLPVKHVTGKHVFYWVSGFFAVIIAVNATMAVLALSTFNGMTNDNAYVDGLNYNRTLEAVEAQQALGWDVETLIVRPGNQWIEVSARYADASGEPISRLKVTAEFIRPVAKGFDFSVPLIATGAGHYEAKTDVPLPGQWTIQIIAQQAGKAPYVLTQRSVVR